MQKVNSYDFPLRIFHWLFAILFSTSFVIAKFIDDESILYAYHMISGILMLILIIMRVFWSFLGEKSSRLSSYKLNPRDLIQYMSSVVSGHSKRYLGHNPASSFAAILMFLFTIALVGTGFMMVLRVNKHFFEEVHEIVAHGFLIIVIIHIGGVIIHQLFHQDGMITSMITGHKKSIEGEDGIKSSRYFAGVVFIIFFLISGLYLNSQFNPQTGVLTLAGKSLQLGEAEGNEGEHEGKGYENYEEDDD